MYSAVQCTVLYSVQYCTVYTTVQRTVVNSVAGSAGLAITEILKSRLLQKLCGCRINNKEKISNKETKCTLVLGIEVTALKYQ